jgi:hypothetical protein
MGHLLLHVEVDTFVPSGSCKEVVTGGNVGIRSRLALPLETNRTWQESSVRPLLVIGRPPSSTISSNTDYRDAMCVAAWSDSANEASISTISVEIERYLFLHPEDDWPSPLENELRR